MTMFVLYVKSGEQFVPPSVEMGESLDATVNLAKDYVDPSKWEAAKKSLSSKRKWKDEDTGLELEIKGKDN